MKIIFLLLLLIIMIEYTQSKTANRTYAITRDEDIKGSKLSEYTVSDSAGKKTLYRLKTTSSDIDTIMLIDYPAKDMIANLEGEWAHEIFDVSFSVYDYKLHKWIDGTMKKISHLFIHKYSIEWNSKRFILKNTSIFSNKMKIFDEQQNKLLAEFKVRSNWFQKYKYGLKIYSDQIPDAIYFFATAIVDHRLQISSEDDD